MKVLVLNGSPKNEKSSSMYLTHAFLEGAAYTDVETINVSKQDIKACAGCYVCWNKTPGKCIFRDDMDTIIEKRIAADVIVWSFPLYVFNVPGGLKNLIDRLLPLKLPSMSKDAESGGHPSRYNLSHQRHVFISTCGFWTTEGNYDSTVAMFNRYFGVDNCTYIFCAQGGIFGKPEAKQFVDTYLETVNQAGKEFANGDISKATQAELAEPMLPRTVYESAADASWGIEIIESGEDSNADDSLKFTKQMAAFYVSDGKERVLEMQYTDIGKTYQILMTSQGTEVISDNFRKYTTRIKTPYAIWRAISNGEIDGQDALFQQKYSVLGDFNLIMQWDELFGAAKPKNKALKTPSQPHKKTNMKVLLIPWIIIWISIAINPTIGGVLGIISAALIPLLWLKYRSVVYENITIPIVAGLSLAVILGVDVRIAIPASYLCFGAMWLISSLTKITSTPLTAHYSYNDHGGRELLDNPIFIRVNRILTICWGCLYLVMTIAMYFLMGTSLLPFTGLLSSVPPAVMGIFTAWFPAWYMARLARG